MTKAQTHPDPTRQIELKVDGMTCAACSARVERALTKVPGVETAAVNLLTGRAEVTGANLDRAGLVKAVEDAGYDIAATQSILGSRG